MIKKYHIIALALIILTIAPAATAFPVTTMGTSKSTIFTHTVFAEDGTETNCHFCHYAREALDAIYTSNDYPFYYVCLVTDRNTIAMDRINEFNLAGYPSVYFDGGNLIEIGGFPDNEHTYRTAIETTGTRPVSAIDLQLNATWLGNATLSITTTLNNNASSTYTGHIHVYVTEVESSMGWLDTEDHPYSFPLLDYAINQNISVAGTSEWTDTRTWNGHEHTDGYGHDFGSIQYGNIEVIAVVYNAQPHQAFSDPPSGNPFTAYWVDDTAGVWIGTQHPPETPSSPSPTNGTINVDVTKDLSWSCSDPDVGDRVTYDLYFGTTNPAPLLKTNLTDKTYDPGAMNFHTCYYWKIIARDNHGHSVEGPQWSFTTASQPDSTPPTINLVKPRSGYLYTHDNDGIHRIIARNSFVIGKITIQVNVSDAGSGIDRVEFFIDGSQKADVSMFPYVFVWKQLSVPLLPHTVKVTAYDKAGNCASAEVAVLKLL